MSRADEDPELTREDIVLLQAMSTDDTLEAIARRLDTSVRTLRRRSRSLHDRIGVSGRVEAAVWAACRGLVSR
ncbi:hypothetical protein DVS28_a3126 [Euzebya pacifica]|uniref:HTH luxR-type domain-containing protein n=1 Tax=Euzebya pacifica TaxID=1608957 RepID=A0A346Y005_9ACTN|nr:hypothetical protein DVS28_a3126 [Euzebya pacifica]